MILKCLAIKDLVMTRKEIIVLAQEEDSGRIKNKLQ
jgi:hypothetical protein